MQETVGLHYPAITNSSSWKPILGEHGQQWPRLSKDPCWCCSQYFHSVPCLMPIIRCVNSPVFHVAGNFCSWNCAKVFFLRQRNMVYHNITLLGLLCFITSHRPLYGCDPSRHGAECVCLQTAMQINPADKYYKIISYDWITNYFIQRGRTIQIYERHRGYQYVNPSKEIQSKQQPKQHEEQRKPEPPKVVKMGIRSKTRRLCH